MVITQQIVRRCFGFFLLVASCCSSAWATDNNAAKSPCNQQVADLQNRAPGELTGWQEITAKAGADAKNLLPENAQMWRIQYVSTGRDNNERTLVCGMVIAPRDITKISVHESGGKRVGRTVAWSHGTLGTIPACQPSYDPDNYILGSTPYGINAVGIGDNRGDTKNGILVGMVDEGFIIAATDYYADPTGKRVMHPYALGKIEGANVVDSVRAAHHLLKTIYSASYTLNGYDVVTWGHSQGGHAAMWAGQLLSSYVAATKRDGDPAMALSGVAVEAGPATLTAPARMLSSYSDLDWLTHAELELTGSTSKVVAMPFFFSYLSKAWVENSKSGKPSASAMPAYPDTGALKLPALIKPSALKKSAATQGKSLVDYVNQFCWDTAGLSAIVPAVAKYETEPFFVKNIEFGPTVAGFQHGNFDRICSANPPPEGIAQWCEWLTYNNLGSLGTSKLDKLPKRGSQLVPVFLAQGSHDEVVHCVASDPNKLPSAEDCQDQLLYDTLRSDYCPSGADKGYLELNIWKSTAGIDASHSNITGLVAAVTTTDLSYRGSRLQRFITAAFDGTLKPGCSASVVNADGSSDTGSKK